GVLDAIRKAPGVIVMSNAKVEREVVAPFGATAVLVYREGSGNIEFVTRRVDLSEPATDITIGGGGARLLVALDLRNIPRGGTTIRANIRGQQLTVHLRSGEVVPATIAVTTEDGKE